MPHLASNDDKHHQGNHRHSNALVYLFSGPGFTRSQFNVACYEFISTWNEKTQEKDNMNQIKDTYDNNNKISISFQEKNVSTKKKKKPRPDSYNNSFLKLLMQSSKPAVVA